MKKPYINKVNGIAVADLSQSNANDGLSKDALSQEN
jgi:hypothetical protein